MFGLPIGPRGTSAIARVVMNALDALFLEVLERLDIKLKLRLRYIDDLRTVLTRIMAGVTIKDGKLVIDEDLEEILASDYGRARAVNTRQEELSEDKVEDELAVISTKLIPTFADSASELESGTLTISWSSGSRT